MLAPRILADFITAEPFRPFRVKMTGGQSFDIWYHEMIRVGRTRFGVHAAIGPDRAEGWHDASLVLNETIEPLDDLERHHSS